MDEKQALGLQTLKHQLDVAVAETHPKFVGKYEDKAAAAGIPVAPITATPGGFCAICTLVRPFLNMAINAFGLFNPKIGQMAKTFMSVLYGTLIPMVCDPK